MSAVGAVIAPTFGASARRESADSPADGDNSASGPTGKTDSGESVSDSEPEGKSQKAEDRSQKPEKGRSLGGRISELTSKLKTAEEERLKLERELEELRKVVRSPEVLSPV